MADWLELHEWYPQAERLLSGGRSKARGDHDCGDPGTLLLTRKGNEWSAYCFRCGRKGRKVEKESLAEMTARVTREQEADQSVRWSAELPEPRVYTLSEWPAPAALWFYKMGLSPARIADLGLYWCPKLGRVVLPVMRDGRVVYWTARSHNRQPKWLTPAIPKDGLVARYGDGKGDTIVVCEDPLSAYMVGRVTEAWSLLGTKLHPKHITALAREGKRVAVWMDDDTGRKAGRNPGQEAAQVIRQKLGLVGLDVRNITSPRDPKYYPVEYIKEKLA